MEQQTIEELKQEISLLQAEIETLKAKKSIAECIRESFSQERPVRVLKRKVRYKAIGHPRWKSPSRRPIMSS